MVWSHYDLGLRLRELDARGIPTEEVVLVQNNENDLDHVAAAVMDGTQLILYTEGNRDADILMRKRFRDGSISDPVVLAGTDQSEAGQQEDWIFQPLQALVHNHRLYVLYNVQEWNYQYSWRLAEFDRDGNLTAPLRNLTEEFQIMTLEDIDFKLDAENGLCVLTWGGMGPESWGGYLLALDCKGDSPE